MKKQDFDNYHSLKLIEALTSLIEKRDTDRSTVEYLKHTLKFIPWKDGIFDAWRELLKILDGQLTEVSDRKEEELQEFIDFLEEDAKKFEVIEVVIANYFKQNRFEDTMTWVNNQLDFAEKLNDSALRVQAFQNKGVVYHILGQLEDAESWYLKSYTLINEIDGYQIKDRILYSLANLYQHYLGDFATSEQYYNEAYQLAITADNKEKQGFYLDHLGMSSFSQKHYEHAIEYHDKAWQLLKDQDRNINIFYHNIQLAQALHAMGEYDRMGRELADVIDLKLKNSDPYSDCWFWILLSEYVAKNPSNYEELGPVFTKQLSMTMDPMSILHLAKDIAYKTKHVPSMVNSNIYIAKHQFKEDPVSSMSLLSEAKHLAIQNNRKREEQNVRDFVATIGLDYETL